MDTPAAGVVGTPTWKSFVTVMVTLVHKGVVVDYSLLASLGIVLYAFTIVAVPGIGKKAADRS